MSQPVGLITGSGTYAVTGLEDASEQLVGTEFGAVEVTTGILAGADVVHVSRHGDGHPRLSHQVNHRGTIAALAELGVGCTIGLTICGAVAPSLALGELIVFDDLYFPSNRLPDGSACTMHVEPGDPRRAHWIFDTPFAEPLRAELVQAIRSSGRSVHSRGCYGHVDGPRFNTRPEVLALGSFGVTAISQTAGPETVLSGEVGIPYALVGYVTDYANGASPESTSVFELMDNMASSAEVFATLLEPMVRSAVAAVTAAPGVNYGFETRPDLYRADDTAPGTSTSGLAR